MTTRSADLITSTGESVADRDIASGPEAVVDVEASEARDSEADMRQIQATVDAVFEEIGGERPVQPTTNQNETTPRLGHAEVAHELGVYTLTLRNNHLTTFS
jgi:hypothetical protein